MQSKSVHLSATITAFTGALPSVARRPDVREQVCNAQPAYAIATAAGLGKDEVAEFPRIMPYDKQPLLSQTDGHLARNEIYRATQDHAGEEMQAEPVPPPIGEPKKRNKGNQLCIPDRRAPRPSS